MFCFLLLLERFLLFSSVKLNTTFLNVVHNDTVDLEDAHHEKVSDIAVVTLEKLMKNELEEDLPDDLRMVRWL